MKRTFIATLAATLLLTGASAQEKKRVKFTEKGAEMGLISRIDSVKLDSVYKYWDAYVAEHPKDENAWHKLYDAGEEKVNRAYWQKRDRNVSNQLRKQLNIVPRMQQAIPGTYTYYYCAYVGSDMRQTEFADSAIAVLPNNASDHVYDRLAWYLIGKKDTLRLTKVLTQYYESGQYPASALQYSYNEMQGMEKGGVYLGNSYDDIMGKFILQLVLDVHKDKILCVEGNAKEHVQSMFESIDIPYSDEIFSQFESQPQDEQLIAIMRYIFEHSKRPVYLPAKNIRPEFLGKIPDEVKACLYNEGLTLRYSAKPYNNMAVKRRNVEQRYLMDYLVLQFHPEVKSFVTAKSSTSLAFNYLVLLYDLLPYYKKHNPEQYTRLNLIFTGIMCKLSGHGWGFPNSDKYYSINYSKEGGPHYEFKEQVGFRRDPNDDEETFKRKLREHQEKNTRVLIKTDPIE